MLEYYNTTCKNSTILYIYINSVVDLLFIVDQKERIDNYIRGNEFKSSTERSKKQRAADRENAYRRFVVCVVVGLQIIKSSGGAQFRKHFNLIN
jgi:hypothetical protein